MARIAELVARIPGAAFAVDEKLRIVAWNDAAEQTLGLPALAVHGRFCFDTVGALDAETGEPCYAACPLRKSIGRPAWLQSRLLKGRAGDTWVDLDCILLRYAGPLGDRSTVSFLTPLGRATNVEYVRALSALEALYPAMTQADDPEHALGDAIEAVRCAVGADAAQLSLHMNPEAHGSMPTIRRAVDAMALSEIAEIAEWHESPIGPDSAAAMEGATIVFRADADGTARAGRSLRWCLAVPIIVEGKPIGALAIASRDPNYAVGAASRVMMPIATQLSVYLRWAVQTVAGTGFPVPSRVAVRYYCFGRFRIEREASEVSSRDFTRQKSLALLKFLVARRGRSFRREILIEQLWPDVPLDLASANLRVVLHDLRHTLEPALAAGEKSAHVIGRGDLIYLDPSERSWVDVEEFERLIRRLDGEVRAGDTVAALKTGNRAFELYRADFLEDEPYEEWCIAERERLRELYIGLLHRLATLHEERGDVAAAIDACSRAVAVDAVREKTHRRLMELHAHAGERDLALRQYEACCRILIAELGIEPDDETQRLYRSILASRVDGVQPGPRMRV